MDIRFQDYRDVNEKFDYVVAMGFTEHVGYKNYRKYMQTVATAHFRRYAIEHITLAPLFQALVASRRNRHEEWFKNSVGHIELCNVPIPVREPAIAAP